jgi:hypothetical protein
MKRRLVIPFIIILIHMSWLAIAQLDSIKYQRLKVFTIIDGKRTEDSFVKNQKTFTMDGRLIREITFDDSTKNTQSYIFYFYKDSKLITEEFYDKNDSLQYIILHKYDPKGRETETDRLEWIKGKMKTSSKTVFVYDKAGIKIAMKESGSRKKPFRVTTYIYSSGNLVREQCESMKPSDNKTERITEYEYGQDGKVTLIKTLEKNAVDTVITRTEKYIYNQKGQLKTKEVKDPQGKMVLSKNYEYYGDGSIRNYFEKDNAGNMLVYNSFLNKNHKINLGTQKSYFDKK